MGLKLIKGLEVPSRVLSTQEAEAGKSVLVGEQPYYGLHSKFQEWKGHKERPCLTNPNEQKC